MSSLPADIRSLSIADRVELAAAIWDSVAEDASAPPLSAAQQAELDCRLANREHDPQAGNSWANVKRRILGD